MSATSAPTQSVRPLYLNGEWYRGGDPLAVQDPATGETIGRVATVDAGGVRAALDDAAAAWPGWRRLTGKERGGYLRRIARGIEDRTDEIARTLTRENGKPLAQSRGEVGMTVDHLEWFAEEARRGYGRVIPHQVDGKRHVIIRQPVGVVGAIAPWNFPLVLAVRKVAPALAAGCPVVLKPASATPLSSVLLAEAIHEAGLPRGVFQLVLGNARAVAEAMFGHRECRKVSFTGSTSVGRQLMRLAADDITKLSLELGGNAPVVVFDDADLEMAVEGTLITKFRNTGQSCIAANRIYVQRGIYDAFREAFVAGVRDLEVGNGLTEGVDIGPMVDERALEAAEASIEAAVSAGATVLTGGGRAELDGYFLEPTVLEGVADDHACTVEETFAPIAPLLVFDDEDEVVARANATEYGLAAYVFTTDLARAWRVGEALEAGTVGINDAVPSTSQSPFGGMKQSGMGRELGAEGLDAFLETKHLSFGGID
ncbi:MAG: NAD-dependent succinate-semialdehyde dehydrogenase [Longimicrobiales bacterium]|nr:NAD-dependent succinate-semialdehyde dehydrogenase [Longimicrobiales bacterium]